MTRMPLSLGLATLAALGFAAVQLSGAQDVRAQSLTLNSGDDVTVSSAGSVGTINNMPVANGTTSYNDSTSGRYGVQTNGTAAFTLEAGGSLTETAPYGDAALDIAGSGPVTVTGGTLTANGQEDVALKTVVNSPVTIEGGVFTANGIEGVALFAGGGTITVAGGSFSANGPDGYDLTTLDGTLDLFSLGDTPFQVNGVPMNNTTLGYATFGTISGTLLDGEMLDTTFNNSDNGIINFNVGTPPVLTTPEPSAFVGLGIGLLGLGALGVKANKRFAV